MILILNIFSAKMVKLQIDRMIKSNVYYGDFQISCCHFYMQRIEDLTTRVKNQISYYISHEIKNMSI